MTTSTPKAAASVSAFMMSVLTGSHAQLSSTTHQHEDASIVRLPHELAEQKALADAGFPNQLQCPRRARLQAIEDAGEPRPLVAAHVRLLCRHTAILTGPPLPGLGPLCSRMVEDPPQIPLFGSCQSS